VHSVCFSPLVSKHRLSLLCLVLVLLVSGASPVLADWTVEDSLGRKVTVEDTPRHIFSGGLNITSTVVKLGAADRLTAVGQFASDTRYSFVADTVASVQQYEQVRPEVVVSHDPDLVLLTPFTPTKIRERILKIDVPVVVTHEVLGLGGVVRNTRLIGRAIGRPNRARREIARLRRRVDTGSVREDPPTVLMYPRSGVVPGRRTLPDLIIRAAGYANLAARVGLSGWSQISPEAIVRGQPRWIVVNRLNGAGDDLRSDPVFSSLRAVKKGRIKSFWPRYLSVAGPHLPKVIEFWRSEFPRP
jgi:iron complex transport system substrate-binding protein